MFVVAFTPSPKSQAADVTDEPLTLGMIVNEIGDPAIPTFVEAATRMLMLGGGDAAKMTTIAAAIIMTAIIRAPILRDIPLLFSRGPGRPSLLNRR